MKVFLSNRGNTKTMKKQKTVIKLTSDKGLEFLLGVESIIDINWIEEKGISAIRSRGAMVSTNWAIQTPEEIWSQINS